MRRWWVLVLPIVLVYVLLWTNIGYKTGKMESTEVFPGNNRAFTYNTSRAEQVTQPYRVVETPFSEALVSGEKPSLKKFLTIAIPTISRPMGFMYIQLTLDSLIQNSNEEERRGVIILIFLADFNETARSDLNSKLVNQYRKYFDSGLMQTIQAPRSYYPSFENLKRTYNHEMSKVKWRSKQNFDYAFMMEYCDSENLSEYYLQLEDDVATIPQYLSVIKDYISSIPQWTCLEFCELGFIAKLYHSHDLTKLSHFLKLFYNEQPNDVIYLHFNELMLQYRRYVRRPTIFQHKGFVSSSGVKRGMLEDILFDDKHSRAPKVPLNPVEFRQLGRVAGPEHVVWVKRRQEEALLHKRHAKGPA